MDESRAGAGEGAGAEERPLVGQTSASGLREGGTPTPEGAGAEERPLVGQTSASGLRERGTPTSEPPRFEAPGAAGAHANPVVDRAAGAPEALTRGDAPSGSAHQGVPSRLSGGEGARGLEPGAGMTPTGAAPGPHPPAPPYEGPEQRLAQADWDRWRAEDRRRRPYTYPEWRS